MIWRWSAIQEQATFNDGVVQICNVIDAAPEGAKPVEQLQKKYHLRYEERMVGVTRYWQALQANAKIEKVIRCQRRPDVTSQDIAVIVAAQYQIKQVQYPEGVVPPAMDLSLERVVQTYEFTSS